MTWDRLWEGLDRQAPMSRRWWAGAPSTLPPAGVLRPVLPPHWQRWHYYHPQAGRHLRPPLAWPAEGQ